MHNYSKGSIEQLVTNNSSDNLLKVPEYYNGQDTRSGRDKKYSERHLSDQDHSKSTTSISPICLNRQELAAQNRNFQFAHEGPDSGQIGDLKQMIMGEIERLELLY